MRSLYVDSGAFIALIWARDDAHRRIAQHYARVRNEGTRLITSDPVISETITRLRYDAGLPAAVRFHEIVAGAVEAGSLSIRESDPDLRAEAAAIMRRYADLALSYADCVGAAVANELRVDAVFALDNDFRIMGYTVEP